MGNSTADNLCSGLILVGSHARGTARADSDIDLIVLTTDPQCFRADTAWLRAIDWNVIAARPAEWQDEDYGVLWSRRMWLELNRDEVEIGFALPSWAEVKPIDPGTQRVITGGCRAHGSRDFRAHRAPL
jgi:predicted nucleotidyltransferase